MASLRKRGKVWYYRVVQADGTRPEIKGCSDRRETERMAAAAETEAAKIKAGLIDAKALAHRDHAKAPIASHVDAFRQHLEAKGSKPKHVALTIQQATRILSLAGVERLADLDAGRVQAALKTLRDGAPAESDPTKREKGLSLGSCNSYRTAVRGFSKWLADSGRSREHVLRGVTGFNAKEDRRHDRRTLSLEEQRRLIAAAHSGPTWRKMSGPARALVYRLSISTGLRYAEIQSIKRESFNWEAEPPTVTVTAGFTKNGETANRPLPADLAEDLRPFVEAVPLGEPVFRLTDDRGATMLRFDLKRAGIEYRDAGGLVFDFHATRCQHATNADAMGITPRVVQAMMRHSSLALTGKYTKPRAVDLDAAATSLPSLRPEGDKPQALRATGTEGTTGQTPTPLREDAPAKGGELAPLLPHAGDVSGRYVSPNDVMASSDEQPNMKRLEAEKTGFDAIERSESQGNESAPRWTRTINPLIKSQLLCQLS